MHVIGLNAISETVTSPLSLFQVYMQENFTHGVFMKGSKALYLILR